MYSRGLGNRASGRGTHAGQTFWEEKAKALTERGKRYSQIVKPTRKAQKLSTVIRGIDRQVEAGKKGRNFVENRARAGREGGPIS